MLGFVCEDDERRSQDGPVEGAGRRVLRAEETRERLTDVALEVHASSPVGQANRPVVEFRIDRRNLHVDANPVILRPATRLDLAVREPRYDPADPRIDVALRQNVRALGKGTAGKEPRLNRSLNTSPGDISVAGSACQMLASAKSNRWSAGNRGARALVKPSNPLELDRRQRTSLTVSSR